MTQNTNIEKVSQAIEEAINECGIKSIAKLPKFMQAIRMAQGIAAMRSALTDEFVQRTLMPLMGTTLGFLTDLDTKDNKYGITVVRDCAIEAMLRGFNVVGNEFNIIAGRFYGTKAGFERQVAEFPGLTNLVLQPGVPVMGGGDKGAVVPYTATWTLNGTPMRIDCQMTDGTDLRIPVKVNAGMGADAVIGKATRKMLYRIYQRINGSSYGLADGEVGDEPILTTGEPAPPAVPAGTPEGKRIQLGGKKTKGAAAPAGEKKAATPPPNPRPPAAAPAEPQGVDLVELHEALAQIDDEWSARGMGAILETWTEEQRLSALTWAQAVINDGPMQIQSRRPAHTLISARQPGED